LIPLREYGFEDAVLFRVGHPNVRVGVNSYSEAKRVYTPAWLGQLPKPIEPVAQAFSTYEIEPFTAEDAEDTEGRMETLVPYLSDLCALCGERLETTVRT